MGSSTIFTGTSRYGADFKQVIDRAVAIASLPLSQLNSQLAALQARSTALSSLDTKFEAMQTALDGLGSGVNATSLSNSDSSVASAQSTSGTLPGTYVLNVISAGSETTTLSVDGLTTVDSPFEESITSASQLTLTVDGQDFTITPSQNTLSSLAEAINAAGAGVTATIINIGPPSAPDYRLSVQSEALGNVAIQLNDGSQNLLSVLSTGSAAQYQINGQPSTPISSNSRTVTLAPGLTAELLEAGQTSIVVSRTSSALADALSSFVAAYNAAVDAINQHRGEGAGALAGDAILSTLSGNLRSLAGFEGGSGSVERLSDLGVTLDQFGKLSFNQDTFDTVAAAHPGDVAAFLGSATTTGFLKSGADIVDSTQDPEEGTIEVSKTVTSSRIETYNDRIQAEEDRIELLRSNLIARIAAADALIASLEQQVTYFTTLFESMNGNR
jgi:flagellar hook-associated protein 2